MKKLFAILIISMAMLSALNGVYKWEGGRYDAPVFNDLGARDSIIVYSSQRYSQNIKLDWMRLAGDFAIEYKVRNKTGFTYVDIYYQMAIDTLSYYAPVTIANLTSPDSGLVFLQPGYAQYIRFYFDDAGAGGETDENICILRINGHWAGKVSDADSLDHHPGIYYRNGVVDSFAEVYAESVLTKNGYNEVTTIKPTSILMTCGNGGLDSLWLQRYQFYSLWGSVNWRLHYNTVFGGEGAGDSIRYATSNGIYNSFYGDGSGNYCSQGNYNTGVGAFAGQHIWSDSHNVWLGWNAAHYLYMGSMNIGIGSSVLDHDGSRYDAQRDTSVLNIVIGRRAMFNSGGDSNVVIGNYALADSNGPFNNRLWIGNKQTEALIDGKFDSAYVKINGHLQLKPLTSDPATLQNGDIWYIDKTNDTLFIYIKGTKKMIVYQ